MRITNTSPSVGAAGAAAYVLGDDSVRVVPITQNIALGAPGGIQDGFMTRQKRKVDHQPLFRAPYAAVIPRYNLENSLTFVTKRIFYTWEIALAFIALHADSLPVSGELTMFHQSATGNTMRYLPNAVMEECEVVRHQGVHVWHRYTFYAPNAWQSSP